MLLHIGCIKNSTVNTYLCNQRIVENYTIKIIKFQALKQVLLHLRHLLPHFIFQCFKLLELQVFIKSTQLNILYTNSNSKSYNQQTYNLKLWTNYLHSTVMHSYVLTVVWFTSGNSVYEKSFPWIHSQAYKKDLKHFPRRYEIMFIFNVDR